MAITSSMTSTSLAPFGKLRHEKVVADLAERRMHQQENRDQQQADDTQHQREPLEAAEAAGAPAATMTARRRRSTPHALRHAEIVERQTDADELGDDGQRVQQEQIDDAERAPELAEALEDQPRMADAGHRAEAQHHFLVDVEHRDEQQQRPQQGGAVVLAGLACRCRRRRRRCRRP